ncbi:MAG: ATP-dependent protease LonB [Candidatus Diapherotrites archaeon]|jgi:ATP-dependent Lon protease|uniref:Archaeal Lon protease n=1 Tax=Candidatus Iainarchaeum sp. TaxID=3101447 RepID=A0A8T5GFK9_9ARCH|nr:ATP-dependent protease LonB [Candidatus Diapherotrites archaeon]MBT7241761.1 ATP-dependent protease LonB [Candidatus Diapherotrites archaeon]
MPKAKSKKLGSDKKSTFAFKDTSEVIVPKSLLSQVIGQDDSVKLVRKAAAQKRNVLLVGIPGTGKSLLAQAMSEILPVQQLQDILIYPNHEDPNSPKVRIVKAGDGKKILDEARLDVTKSEQSMRMFSFFLPIGWMILASVFWKLGWYPDVVFAALLLIGAVLLIGLAIGGQMRSKEGASTPKLLINNLGKKIAPFFEGTGSRAGALLGDVRHDPLQSGGLGTPPHLRVEPGMIHRASGGVLFIDEIATLPYKSQQELLSAMQERKFSITGQSENSSGAMTRTEAVPCDFVLVAAGSYDDLQKVHPALRSRIRGYGYEVYMNNDMKDTEENRHKIAQFVAQEVKKDKKIPHFDKEAVEAIIFEAKRRAQRKGKLTLKLRDLGGLVRAAGDVAREKGHKIVSAQDVYEAKVSSKTLEAQMVDKAIEMKRDYEVYLNKGRAVGRVNGLAVFGDGSAGSIIPIEAAVSPPSTRNVSKVIATGKLGEIAKEAVENVSVIFKKISEKKLVKDIHIQFLQTYEGVEGDSASVSIATAVISAIEDIPIRQDIAMTGSLSVRGEVLPVGGVSSKVSAAIMAGFLEVIVPKSNIQDIVLPKQDLKKIKIIPVSGLTEVLEIALEKGTKKKKLLAQLKKIVKIEKTPLIKKVIRKTRA